VLTEETQQLLKAFIENYDYVIAGVAPVLTFFLGRYTSHLDDRRSGMKDINENFYKPFMGTYLEAHHAYALYFVDLDMKYQISLVEILLHNMNRVSPRIKKKILDLDQCYSGYSEDLRNGIKISSEDKEFVEKQFAEIYSYIEKQYIKNERKLYCSLWKRFLYSIQEFLIRHNLWMC